MTMPPAAEKLVADLKAAADAASQLEAASPDAERASLLLGIRDVAACAACIVVAHHGSDWHYLLQQAELLRAAAGGVLNDAEVLEARTEVFGRLIGSSRAPQIHGEPRSEGAVDDCLADSAPTQGCPSTEAPASEVE